MSLPEVGFAFLLSLFAMAVQCSSAAGQKAADSTQKAQAVLTLHCGKCHGANATAGFNINDHYGMLSKGHIKPGDPTRSRAYIRAVLSPDDPMPPKSRHDALTPNEQTTLKIWIEAGAKEAEKPGAGSRKFVSTEAVYAAIQADLAGTDKRDRQYLRYFTLTHLYNAGADGDALHAYRHALSKLLNSLSWQKRITVPQSVDATHTVLRIDLRHYAWTADTWRKLLAVYPYAVVFQLVGAKSVCASTGCDVPCVRADWFVARAGQPLLYHDLLALPRTVHELEAKLQVDVDKNIREGTAIRAGFGESGVSRNNRIVERHESAYGAYWRSYDFSSSAGQQNIFQHPLAFEAAGGEIIFNLPNGLQGYMLINGKGERINTGPVNIVSNKENPNDPVVRNGLTCMACHTRGMKRFSDQMRAVVETTPAPDFDRNKALALYVEHPRLAALTEEDSKRFAVGVHETGAEVGDAEPILALAAKYDAPLNLTQAAAETGLSAEALQARLWENASLGSLLAVLRTPGGQIKRDAWEQAQADVTARLALGAYLPPHITVGKNGEGQFASIAEALRSAPVGARITIGPGVYNESLVIDKSVELTSSGEAGEVRIEVTGKPCASVQAANVTLRGITLHTQGVFAGKAVYAAEITSGNLSLFNCNLRSETGAALSASGEQTSLLAKNCSVHDGNGNGEGVLIITRARAQLEECEIFNCSSAGVSVIAGGSATLKHCKVHDNRREGVYAADNSHLTVENCDLNGNAMTGASVLNSVAHFQGCQVHDNKGDGFWVTANSEASGDDCAFAGNAGAGASISDNAKATLRHCRLENNLHNGVWIGRGGYGIMETCDSGKNGWTGIGIKDGGKGRLNGCKLYDNKEHGLEMLANSSGSVQDCAITGNGGVGVSISENSSMTMQRSQVHHNLHDGIWIGNGGHGVVEDSPICSNSGAGIALHAGRAELRACRLNDNRLAGIWAHDQSIAEAWRCDLTRNTEGAYKAQPGSMVSIGTNKQ